MTDVRKVVAVVAAILATTPQVQAAEVWLSGIRGKSGFLDLFQPDAPWTAAAAKVRVLKVSTQFIMQFSEQELRETFAGLRSRGIGLAVEAGFLYGYGEGATHCGHGMEGFAARNTARAFARRIAKFGGELSYVAMDEPLWFGRHAVKPTSCYWGIPQITSEVAEGVAQLREAFPAVQVGDIEPIGGQSTFDWPAEIAAWADAFRVATGRPLAFIHADIQWSHPWQVELKAVADIALGNGIPFGVIVDSDRPETSDVGWTTHAEAGLQAVRAVLGKLPDQLIFQSWTPHPTRFLPDSEPGTLTNLVRRTPQ